MKVFFDNLEFYSLLSVQPINYDKTEALWSARAWGVHEGPKFNLICGTHHIKWCTSFKYLGYWITPKLGWSNMISKSVVKIRQRISMINSCRVFGSTSPEFRKVLFSCYILPIFTGLFAIFPLFSKCQRSFLSRFYYTSLKRVLHCQHWSDFFFAFALNEVSLDNRCTRYWIKYLKGLANSIDGELLLEQFALNSHRDKWLKGDIKIRSLCRSKRFCDHESVLGKCLSWYEDNPLPDTIAQISYDDIELLEAYPETF
jgi:hypothetical protein